MSKPEAKEAKEAKEPKEMVSAANAGGEAKGGGMKAWMPAIIAILLAPAASFAVAEYVLLPRLQAKLSSPTAAHGAEGAEAEAAPAASDSGKPATPGENFEFNNVVVNLAGTMGTRYLKVSFIVTGIGGKGVKPIFDAQKAKLTDVTLSVLSSLTLADLEEPGSKNVLREKLVAAYNQTLGKRLVEQVYFADFVIQ